MQKFQRLSKNWRFWVALGVLLIALVGVSVWIALPKQTSAQKTSTYQTATIRAGDLSLSASGTGNLQPGRTVDLAFSTVGTVTQLNTQIGQQVSSGDVLAVEDGQDALKLRVAIATVAVEKAQKTLDDLNTHASAALAQALADQADAQTALVTTKANVHYTGDPRCETSVTQSYYFQYQDAQNRASPWENMLQSGNSQYGHDYILTVLTPIQKERAQAYGNWTYCEGYSDAEILSSQADYQAAIANAQLTQKAYLDMKANNGLDPVELKIAETALLNAQADLTAAQTDLAGTTLTAPISGMVTTVNADLGQKVSAGTFISIADLASPVIQVNIDETDLSNFSVGCSAAVTFDTLPGRTFSGTVTQISPALVAVRNVNVIQGQVALSSDTLPAGQVLPIGLSASVEVSCQSAKNAVLAPILALHYVTDQPTYVYILNAAGKPEKREVEVGLKSATYAEITSGLKQGEVVITSEVSLP